MVPQGQREYAEMHIVPWLKLSCCSHSHMPLMKQQMRRNVKGFAIQTENDKVGNQEEVEQCSHVQDEGPL